MSTDENMAIVRRYTEEGWGKQNLVVLDELVAPDMVDDNSIGVMHQQPGSQGVKSTIQRLQSAFPQFSMTIDDPFAAEDKVVLRWTIRSTIMAPSWGSRRPANRLPFAVSTSFGRRLGKSWRKRVWQISRACRTNWALFPFRIHQLVTWLIFSARNNTGHSESISSPAHKLAPAEFRPQERAGLSDGRKMGTITHDYNGTAVYAYDMGS